MGERLIFHVDVNSAFLSWEAARRVAEGGEDIRLIPSAIGGDREKRTGVILAKSIPAKRYGVKTGEPVAMALRKCPKLFLARPDHHLYERCSAAFVRICREYTPVVEQYSIDECFLDMSGMEKIYPDPRAVADVIRNRIRSELGFTVNVGVSDVKLLAKMASDFEKPDKVHTLYKREIEEKMWPLPVRDLFSVGGMTAERLTDGGIYTIGDLARADLTHVQRLVGKKNGETIRAYARGEDDSPVSAQAEEAKGYSISTTLEKDVTSHAAAHKVLLALSDSVSARMRADGKEASSVSVTIRDNVFQDRSHQKKLAMPTDISGDIYAVTKRLFGELWDGRTPLRLIGVALGGITRAGEGQLSLFPDEEKEKARLFDKARDTIHSRFGSGAIIRASDMTDSPEVGKKYKAQLEEREKE